VLWSKFWLNLLPLLLLGELLVFLSNLLLQVPDWMMLLSLVTIALMTFGITAICVGTGAIYPKFNFDNAAEIPTSFGGAVCMIVSLSFVGIVVMIEAWPIYLLTTGALARGRLHAPEFWVLAPSLAIVVLLTVVAVFVPIRQGLKSLEQLKE
jgi:ABC-2 type transport system permease protein